MKRFLALTLVLSTLLSLAGCSKSGNNGDVKADLMTGVIARKLELSPDSEAGSAVVAEFGLRLAKNCWKDGENLLVSPLSVLCALAMTANGAEGETLAQMEKVFGITSEELNSYLRWYMDALPQGNTYRLHVANSIWVNDHARFTPNQEFLQVNADYYGADIYTAPFDASVLDAINGWVEEHTDGMIPRILDYMPENAMMYLVNALAFEAQWACEYKPNQVHKRVFTKEDGTEQTAELMYSTERVYLENELATGFIKEYEGEAYAFVALLPKEGTTVDALLRSLTGEELRWILDDAQRATVRAAIPKFEMAYSAELSEILAAMGMKNAFDAYKADFSGLGTFADGKIYISRVLHKTFISVGEQGTKAGAATAIEAPGATSVAPVNEKEVYLDRPFVYLLIDCESGVPFFVGVMTDVNAG